MNLFILRHGLAAEASGGRDADRPLTEQGKSKMREIAKTMRELELSLDLILSSPYKRAWQTAELVAETLGLTNKLEPCNALAPMGDAGKLLAEINHRRPSPEAVLLVGHEPFLSELISLLVAGERGSQIIMKKGSLAKLQTAHPRPGRCAALKWLLTPKQMALIQQS